MTTLKTIIEHRNILDFGKEKISKSFVRQSLRRTKFEYIIQEEEKSTLVINHIMVGMYRIELLHGSEQRLKNFKVFIRDSHDMERINIIKDSRFANQNWIKLNQEYKLKIGHLVDIIMHCHRLDKLKVFL